MQKLCCVCTRQQSSASLDYFVTSSPPYLHQFSAISGGNCDRLQPARRWCHGLAVWPCGCRHHLACGLLEKQCYVLLSPCPGLTVGAAPHPHYAYPWRILTSPQYRPTARHSSSPHPPPLNWLGVALLWGRDHTSKAGCRILGLTALNSLLQYVNWLVWEVWSVN